MRVTRTVRTRITFTDVDTGAKLEIRLKLVPAGLTDEEAKKVVKRLVRASPDFSSSAGLLSDFGIDAMEIKPW